MRRGPHKWGGWPYLWIQVRLEAGGGRAGGGACFSTTKASHWRTPAPGSRAARSAILRTLWSWVPPSRCRRARLRRGQTMARFALISRPPRMRPRRTVSITRASPPRCRLQNPIWLPRTASPFLSAMARRSPTISSAGLPPPYPRSPARWRCSKARDLIVPRCSRRCAAPPYPWDQPPGTPATVSAWPMPPPPCVRAATRPRPLAPNHRSHQVFQRGFGIGTLARMHGRGLHNRAARRDQPMKALARRQLSDVARGFSAGANRGNALQRASDEVQLHARVDGEQRLFVQLDGGQQNALDIARQNDPGIHELAALDARYDTNDRIIIGPQRVHEGPPCGRCP